MEVANWALEHSRPLSQPGANVEQSPLFHLAGALHHAPVQQTQALIRSAIKGFSDLPAPRKAEALRLAMQTTSMVQQAGGPDLVQQLAGQAASPGASPSGGARRPQAASTTPAAPPVLPAPPLVQNFMRIAQEAKFNEMPREDFQVIAQEAQADAARYMQPQQLVDVVQELRPDEREQLTDKLVEAKILKEEHRAVCEDALRPGGYADQLSMLFRVIDPVVKHAKAVVAVPVVELLLALLLGLLPCGTPLAGWLNFDALLSLGVCGLAYLACVWLAFEKIRADPVGTVQRWQEAPANSDWAAKLEAAIPGADFDQYRVGVAALGGCVVLLIMGVLWTVVGVLELFATAAFGCSGIVVFFCALFVLLRVALIVAVIALSVYAAEEVHRHKSRGAQGNARQHEGDALLSGERSWEPDHLYRP